MINLQSNFMEITKFNICKYYKLNLKANLWTSGKDTWNKYYIPRKPHHMTSSFILKLVERFEREARRLSWVSSRHLARPSSLCPKRSFSRESIEWFRSVEGSLGLWQMWSAWWKRAGAKWERQNILPHLQCDWKSYRCKKLLKCHTIFENNIGWCIEKNSRVFAVAKTSQRLYCIFHAIVFTMKFALWIFDKF